MSKMRGNAVQEAESGPRAGRKSLVRAAIALTIFLCLVLLAVWAGREQAYLWVKALHIIAVISWMAGLLYMPRLFIYHTDAAPGSQQSETFKVMEQRLLKIIMNPAMMISWAMGLYLAWDVYGFSGGWLHTKLALVTMMTGVHVYFSRAVRLFANDNNTRPARHWRIMNEVPTILMIVIVILVVVKPF